MDIHSRNIRLLQANQKNLLIYGIGPHEKPFNKRNLLTLFSFSSCIFVSGAYFFFEAETFEQYTQSVYTTTALINVTLMFTIVVRNMRQFFDCVNQAEEIIDGSELLNEVYAYLISIIHIQSCSTFPKKVNSKLSSFLFQYIKGLVYPTSKAIYRKCNRFNEKTTKNIIFRSIYIAYPLVMIIMLVGIYCVYLTTDLGKDAFQLPFPVWYELKQILKRCVQIDTVHPHGFYFHPH